jgi:hypothetical protein
MQQPADVTGVGDIGGADDQIRARAHSPPSSGSGCATMST